jgi:hypothetical protein
MNGVRASVVDRVILGLLDSSFVVVSCGTAESVTAETCGEPNLGEEA